MADCDANNAAIEYIDTNQDGCFDRKECPQWIPDSRSWPCSPREPLSRGLYCDEYKYKTNYTNTSGCLIDKYAPCGTTTMASDFISDRVIHTSSSAETNSYLERTPNLYKDCHPQVIHRPSDCSTKQEQRVFLRCLQPPAPEPGMLIIKEVRPPQPPPLPPLIIREQPPARCSPPALILRERPPPPPPRIPCQTITRCVPALPVPRRSVIIERFPPPPEKPRDIIIERWLPYERPTQRRTIVEPAPPAPAYPQPRNQFIIYDCAKSCVYRRFRYLGVSQKDPCSYIARYGASLLDPATLVQRARNAGVTEDISCPGRSYSKYKNTCQSTIDYDWSNDAINRCVSPSYETNYDECPRTCGTEAYNVGKPCYSSEAPNLISDNASPDGATHAEGEYHPVDASRNDIVIDNSEL
ncbi:unnamed protein product [Rotaria sp. Silwood1]|nr:unnamed protein product [Rotaria sp. Silwood1]